MTTVALVDDHAILRDPLAHFIESLDGFRVIAVASNGIELMERIKAAGSPDILLLDLDMPVMNGYATASWLKKNHPDIKIIIFSMFPSEVIMVQLVKMGVRSFLQKDIAPAEFKKALVEVAEKGFYFVRDSGKDILDLIQNIELQISSRQNILLTDREIALIKHCCSDDTSQEIGDKMNLSRRAVDDMKTIVFNKIGVRGRTGLAVYAMKHGLVHL